eukprot:CCRYP_000078-RA/>CCRYP_000078-RA protein AED:0.35 eAED:0.35 QI:0/-1/0/1/-1/1/1/0/119
MVMLPPTVLSLLPSPTANTVSTPLATTIHSLRNNTAQNKVETFSTNPPHASDLLKASHFVHFDNDYDSSDTKLSTATTAILSTKHGDITIKLFPKETPTTIQNFIGHAQSGYFDNVIFH